MVGARRSFLSACVVAAGLTVACMPAVATTTDLEVTYIERTPKYSSYVGAVRYSQGTFPDDYLPYFATFAYGLSGQTSSTKRWPDDGETVTFTAHIYNRGDTSVSSFTYEWRLDDSVIGSGTYSTPMPAGSVITLSQTWAWHWAAHRVKFAITGRGDSHPSNDFIEDYTNAPGFYTFIDYGYAQKFEDNTPLYPGSTDSISEWMQHQRTFMNQMFDNAGSVFHWRYDRLDFLNDDDPTPAVTATDYDGAFPQRFTVDTGDIRSGGGYDLANQVEYAFLHELGHQCGLIDLYQLDLYGETNYVNGRGYLAEGSLMHHQGNSICEHSAKAMNQWYTKRRGYFGQYQFSIPTTNRVRFLSADGEPLANAVVKVYEKISTETEGASIPNVIKFQGTTNANGVYTIPNASLSYKSYFWADTGDVLHNNPFGYIWCIGQNNLLLLRVEKWGAADYAWLPVTECNIAYWNGNTSTATYTKQMILGREMQYAPPAELTELNAADWAGYSQDAATTTWDDTTRKQVGTGSIVFDTTGGWDCAIIYPKGIVGHWDLSAVTHLKVRFYTTNTHGFQNWSPWIRLCDYDNNYVQFQPNYEILDAECHNQWHSYSIPMTGDATWQRTTQGAPDITDINYIEIHADTWDAGFQIWVDGLMFYPQPAPKDTDADGLPDEWETGFLGTLAYTGADDPDDDGLINSNELAHKTDPSLADTDGDGIEDGEEIALGFDPTDKTSGFILLSVARSTTDPAWFEITWHADQNADVVVSWTSGRPGSSRTWNVVDGASLADKTYIGSSTWKWTDKGTDPDMGGLPPGSVTMRYYRLSQD